jgi:hypothetical protein
MKFNQLYYLYIYKYTHVHRPMINFYLHLSDSRARPVMEMQVEFGPQTNLFVFETRLIQTTFLPLGRGLYQPEHYSSG